MRYTLESTYIYQLHLFFLLLYKISNESFIICRKGLNSRRNYFFRLYSFFACRTYICFSSTIFLFCFLPFSVFSLLQILSWLCRKGEETLSRYNVTLADSLAAAKLQEREFQRFLNLAQVRLRILLLEF